jgi:voltage-gated potassium channel
MFITTGINHKLDAGDTLVCIGSNENLDSFEEALKKEKSTL